MAVSCLLVEQNKIITLAADVLFLDGMAFLLTLSRNIKFVTAEQVPVRLAKTLVKNIERVLQVYCHDGFIVRTILMDVEFEKIRSILLAAECNSITTAAKEHVSKAE